MRVAPELLVLPQDYEQLLRIARARSAPAHLKERANIVLLAARGLQNIEIAKELGVTDRTVYKWRGRYIDLGVEGLHDAPRPGKPRTIPEDVDARILEATLSPPPNRTHWSVRAMAEYIGCSPSKVLRTWKQHELIPHKVRAFKISNDKHFEEKLEDVVGLYISPPENALVFSMDEKSQIQALDRSQKILPIRPGLPEHQAWDYRRHGTLTLFAALNVQSGEVISDIQARHRYQEFIAFLGKIDDATDPNLDLHIIWTICRRTKRPRFALGSMPILDFTCIIFPRAAAGSMRWSACFET